MLVLSRKEGESIVINGGTRYEVVVAVVEVKRGQGKADKVRIGINAPKDVPVHRLEIQARISRTGSTRDESKQTPVEKLRAALEAIVQVVDRSEDPSDALWDIDTIARKALG